MPRGDPLRNQGPLINKISSSINKPSPINPRLLPQGTGALIGKSALLGTGGPPSRPPTLTASPTPLASQTTSSPKPSSGTPASVHVPDKATSSAKVVSAGLQKKTTSLLDDYFGIRILDEAQQCIEELQCPDYHPEIVKEAINLALDKGASFVDPLVKLLEHLYTKKTFKTEDLENGCLLYGSLLEDIGIDLLKAPTQFGEVEKVDFEKLSYEYFFKRYSKALNRKECLKLDELEKAYNFLNSSTKFTEVSDLKNSEDDSNLFLKGKTRTMNSKSSTFKRSSDGNRESFAALVPANINLIYLRRSLAKKLLNRPETFENCLLLYGGLRFEAVEGILKAMEDTFFRKEIFNSMTKTLEANPAGAVSSERQRMVYSL
ncbi:eukaryotic translation initiation factor isoform 4G-1 [Hordeum vulgare]|nr:eukaryotic translation initiation factor isoform 4G-1 [Hordeum vulgare]